MKIINRINYKEYLETLPEWATKMDKNKLFRINPVIFIINK